MGAISYDSCATCSFVKRLCEFTALSVNPCVFLRSNFNQSGAVLCLNPSFISQNLRNKGGLIEVQNNPARCFPSFPHAQLREMRMHLLCPVQVLTFYIKYTVPIGSTELLFIFCAGRCGWKRNASLNGCLSILFKSIGRWTYAQQRRR